MFDDKQSLNTNTPTPGGQVPPNLPTSQGASSPPVAPAEPEDILGEVDQSDPVPASVAKTSTPPAIVDLGPKTSEVPPAMSGNQPSIAKEPVFNGKRKVVAILMAAVIVLILGGAAWYGYQALTADRSAPSSNNNVPPVNQNNNVVPDANTNGNINQNTNVTPPAPLPPIDTDRDGLTDEEEALYGTNPNVVDSDQDGLTDRDEIKVFGTDPNNPDTDGDGFTDGSEVRAGYDPKGDGRLFEIN